MCGLKELMQTEGLAQSQEHVKHLVNTSKYQAVYIFVSETQILLLNVDQAGKSFLSGYS